MCRRAALGTDGWRDWRGLWATINCRPMNRRGRWCASWTDRTEATRQGSYRHCPGRRCRLETIRRRADGPKTQEQSDSKRAAVAILKLTSPPRKRGAGRRARNLTATIGRSWPVAAPSAIRNKAISNADSNDGDETAALRPGAWPTKMKCHSARTKRQDVTWQGQTWPVEVLSPR